MANNNKKRRNNKKEKKDVSMYGLYVKLLSATTTTMTCYHGSALEKFSPNHKYSEIIHDYLIFRNECCKLDLQPNGMIVPTMKFLYEKNHMQVIEGEQFGRFIFAFYSQIHLDNKDPEILEQRKRWGKHYLIGISKRNIEFATQYIMKALLNLGLRSKYCYVTESKDQSKYLKFCRDVADYNERGMIKCLARETKNFCHCMKQDKAEAMKMEKIVSCYGCKKFFPKEQLFKCKGCNEVFYHNRQCQINNWPEHKLICNVIKTFPRGV